MKKAEPHYIGHKKRLKDKFLKGGIDTLADYEVLELVLSFSQTRKDVKELAKAMIGKFGSFADTLDASPEELANIEGIGPSSVAAIKIVKETSVKYLQEKIKNRCVVSSPEALINYCKATMKGLSDEEFRVIFLNSKNEILGDEVLCRGTIDQTAVYPRKVIERALFHKASSLIFVHNHPSGHPHPSGADMELTKVLKDAATSVQIRVHDHLVIAKNGHYSFAEEGKL